MFLYSINCEVQQPRSRIHFVLYEQMGLIPNETSKKL